MLVLSASRKVYCIDIAIQAIKFVALFTKGNSLMQAHCIRIMVIISGRK